MFSVIFEIRPRPSQWDTYLGAKVLRPELEQIDGFVDNLRYRILTRDGSILTLSNWRDEKEVVRWRTHVRHHEVQQLGRAEVLLDYHLRVAQVIQDSRIPLGYTLQEQRLDETETGEGTTISLIDIKRPEKWEETNNLANCAEWLWINPMDGYVSWAIFDAVLSPGDIILLISWRDRAAAEEFERAASLQEGARLRRIRIVRDYGMFDGREAPRYSPEVAKSEMASSCLVHT